MYTTETYLSICQSNNRESFIDFPVIDISRVDASKSQSLLNSDQYHTTNVRWLKVWEQMVVEHLIWGSSSHAENIRYLWNGKSGRCGEINGCLLCISKSFLQINAINIVI